MAKQKKRRQLKRGSTYERSYKETRKFFNKFYNYKSEKYIINAYKKAAKMADQRLVRLEKAAASDPKYENILGYAYKRAQRDVRAWDKRRTTRDYEKPRFNRNMPMRKDSKGKMVPDIAAIRSKMTDIERFLLSATSTVKGTEEVYEKRADILNESAGVPKGDAGRVTWEDLYNYYASVSSGILTEKTIGYNTMIRAIASIKKTVKGMGPKQIKDATKGMKNWRKEWNETVWSTDKMVNETVKELIGSGFDINTFFEGNK